MYSIPGRPPRQRLLTGAAAVLAVHLLFALVWLRHKPGPDRQTPRRTQAPLLLRLWPMPVQPPTTAPPLPLHTETSPARSVATSRRTASRPAPTDPQAITVPAAPQAITLPADAVPQPAAPAPAPATASTPPVPAPLNLRLPDSASAPWRLQNPALDDRRANRTPLTLEQRLAGAMGGDISRVVEERLGPDEIRFHRGSDCVLARRSRAGQLGVGNDALRDAWVVGPC
jgi:hypothetical protein